MRIVTTTILAILLLHPALPGQDNAFRVQLSRWSNHDLPDFIQTFIPNGQPKLDGVMAVVTVENGREMEAVEVTLSYRQNGKRMKQVRTAILVTTGCTPEPCRWAPILFDVGVIEMESATATVQEWATE